MMKVSELSDVELSKLIAEKLEPKPMEHMCGLQGFNPMQGDSCPSCNDRSAMDMKTVTSMRSDWRNLKNATEVWIYRNGWQARDMVNDPAMTVMLLEKLHEFGSVALCGDNGWGVTVTFIDERGTHTNYTRPDLTNSPTIGRAVAITFCLAHGLEVGGSLIAR